MEPHDKPAFGLEGFEDALDVGKWMEQREVGSFRSIGQGAVMVMRRESGDVIVAGMPFPGGDGSRPSVMVPGHLVGELISRLQELHVP